MPTIFRVWFETQQLSHPRVSFLSLRLVLEKERQVLSQFIHFFSISKQSHVSLSKGQRLRFFLFRFFLQVEIRSYLYFFYSLVGLRREVNLFSFSFHRLAVLVLDFWVRIVDEIRIRVVDIDRIRLVLLFRRTAFQHFRAYCLRGWLDRCEQVYVVLWGIK